MTEPFENLGVSLDELPNIQEIDFQPIDENYRKVSLISWGILFIILVVGPPIVFTLSKDSNSEFIYYGIGTGVAIFCWVFNIIWVNKAFSKKKYALRQKDIIYTKGLLWSKRTTIPFNRIQHAEVKQGPIERIFKLHNLKVFTAGGNSSDLSIPGLSQEKAVSLKEFILNQIEAEEDASN